jgi:biopolymer transport protein ExbB/TolQ
VNLLILLSAYMEWAVLLLLLFLSVWSMKIMIERRRAFHSNREFSKFALGELKKAASSDPLVIDRTFRSFTAGERLKLERGLPILATLGSNAPFIGLFGTVLGIIRAFAALSETSGGATTVMAGISQALYATAAGLFVAIPAVVAYNTFSTKLRTLIIEAEAVKDKYVAEKVKGRD